MLQGAVLELVREVSPPPQGGEEVLRTRGWGWTGSQEAYKERLLMVQRQGMGVGVL